MKQPLNSLQAWVPRSLLEMPAASPLPQANGDGLTAVSLQWADGHLLAPELLSAQARSPKTLVVPRLADPHVHLDKAFSWGDHPNRIGTYDGAMAANLREHRTRTHQSVLERGQRAMEQACSSGLRALRSHVDSLGDGAKCSWNALLELRDRWRDRIELQLVALLPLDYWGTPEGRQFAQWVASVGGWLGGVPVTHRGGARLREQLRALIALADDLGCGIDLHLDESDRDPAAGLLQLLAALRDQPVSIPITCSHLSSVGLLPAADRQRLAEQMADHGLSVVALPLTNAWLLARKPGITPTTRPLAPIRCLQRAGVCVAVGCDNVADPWYPTGGFDPITLMAQSLPLAQLAPWQRLGLAPFTTAAAELMGLGWDGLIRKGAPADLIVLEASSWSDALMLPTNRRILIAGRHWTMSNG